jgi:hypothetical protein
MLLNISRVRAWHDNGKDDFIDQPFVVGIGAGNVDSQRSATPVYKNMDFAAALAAVNRTLARSLPTQWRWTRFAVNSLPCPLDASPPLVKTNEFAHQTLKDAALLPFLETLMKGCAAHPKPTPMHSFH